MKRIVIIIGVLVAAFFLAQPLIDVPDMDENYEIGGDIADLDEVTKAEEVLKANLAFSEEKNMEGYLSTIVSSGHEETREAMADFFELYDVKLTLLSFEVIEQSDEEIVVKVQQKTEAETIQDSTEEYRDHIADALHTFVKEDGRWKIKETSITDTTFID